MGEEEEKIIEEEEEDKDILKYISAEEENILSPQLYLHLSIIYAIKALPYGIRYGGQNIETFYNSLTERILMIDQAEKIAIALNYIEDGEDSEYHKAVAQYEEKLKKEMEANDARSKLIRDNKLATFKLQKIISAIGKSGTKYIEAVL